MKTLEFRGSGTRTISADDWTSVGVKSKEINVSQGQLVEVNDQAAAWLMENETSDWRELGEREAEKRKAEEAEKAEAASAQSDTVPSAAESEEE